MKLPEPISDAADKARDLYTETADKAKDLYGTAADKAQDLYGSAADKTKDLYEEAAAKAKDLYEEAADKGKDLYGEATDSLKDASDKAVGAFNKLTTTQKVVGGALLAAGLVYLVAPKKKGKAKRAKVALERLLLFVNDRIAGYQRAVAETKDAQHKGYYQKLVSQSQEFADTLNGYLTKKGGERETGTTLKGKLYRKLMDAQALVTARNEQAILAANVYGERWALKAYKKALRRKALKGGLREAVEKQYAESQKTYQKLKELTTQTA